MKINEILEADEELDTAFKELIGAGQCVDEMEWLFERLSQVERQQQIKNVFLDIDGKEYCNTEVALSILLDEEVLFAGEGDIYYQDKKVEHTVTLTVLCNDLFAWASADGEGVSYDEVPSLFRAWQSQEKWAIIKWVCKHRGDQPQKPIKERMQKDGSWDSEMESLQENYSEWHRASGECICEICKQEYRKHPEFEKADWLTKLCNGDFVKL